MNKKKTQVYKENLSYVIFLMIFIAIIAKIIEHLLLPAKYYYDNNRILNTINDPEYAARWSGSYEVAANFFRRLNIFHFTSFLQWSIFLSVFFNIILIILFVRNKGLDLKQSIFSLMCVGILNIYIFNVGKDAIQFLIFFVLLIIINSNISNVLKVIGCFAVLYWESTFYRNYYIIIAFFFVVIVLGAYMLRTINKRMNFLKILFVIALLYGLVYAFLALSKIFMPADFQEVMECKKEIDIMQANTMIDDKIVHNGNLFLYMENYIINSIRMAFPVELLRSGVYYLPFVGFEIFLLFYIGKAISRLYMIDFKQVLALSVFIAYFMGSVLFEPDFGSFVRHEAATFPILYILIFNPYYWKIEKEKGKIRK